MSSYRFSARAIGAVVVALVIGDSAQAAAQEVLHIDPEGNLSCMTAEACMSATERCADAVFACTLFPTPGGTLAGLCLAPDPHFCCATADECPPLAGAGSPRCTMRVPGLGAGVCVYPAGDPACSPPAGTELAFLRACLQPPVGVPAPDPYGTVAFAAGDCDGDLIPNGRESSLTAVCVPDTDGGVPMDAGIIEAGVPSADGGVIPEFDGGAPFDAGTEEDAGLMRPDLGAPDVDANLPPGTGLDFTGGGGCACDATNARASLGGGWLSMLLALGGVLVWRRRRRTSSFDSARAIGRVVAVGLMMVAVPAAAGPPEVVTLESGAPQCVSTMDCSSAPTDCPADGPICNAFTFPGSGGRGSACVDVVTAVYCCNSDDDCPDDGTLGLATCVDPSGGDPSLDVRICVYPGVDLCRGRGVLDAEALDRCFVNGIGTAPYGLVPWAFGDCDGDAAPNGTDACPCDPSPGCGPDLDGGVGIDAGPTVEMDLGVPAFDASIPPGQGLNYRGGGGCVCAAGGSPRHTTRHAGLALLALGAIFAFRRHHTSRGRSTRRLA